MPIKQIKFSVSDKCQLQLTKLLSQLNLDLTIQPTRDDMLLFYMPSIGQTIFMDDAIAAISRELQKKPSLPHIDMKMIQDELSKARRVEYNEMLQETQPHYFNECVIDTTQYPDLLYRVKAKPLTSRTTRTVALISPITCTVTYLNNRAKTDPIVQKTINEYVDKLDKNIKLTYEYGQPTLRLQTKLGELVIGLETENKVGYDAAYISIYPRANTPDGQTENCADLFDLASVRILPNNWPNQPSTDECHIAMSLFADPSIEDPTDERTVYLNEIYEALDTFDQ